jgi:hypothetical protein
LRPVLSMAAMPSRPIMEAPLVLIRFDIWQRCFDLR